MGVEEVLLLLEEEAWSSRERSVDACATTAAAAILGVYRTSIQEQVGRTLRAPRRLQLRTAARSALTRTRRVEGTFDHFEARKLRARAEFLAEATRSLVVHLRFLLEQLPSSVFSQIFAAALHTWKPGIIH
ncbi:hypothetical protein U1Q18_052101 [Sarracenia purpurea var. burkii]